MTRPRRVLPGTIYLVTRRCSEQRFFLRPDPRVGRIFEYLLAYLAKQYEIQIHGFVVMSNHYHLVVTDVDGRLPDFQRDLNSKLARAINKFRVRRESFWDRRSYHAAELTGDGAVLGALAYTLANPVKARLVNRARHWLGATSVGMRFGHKRWIQRPEEICGKDMPKEVELALSRPEVFAGSSDEELFAAINDDVCRRERLHRKEGKEMGMGKVLKQDWRLSPESEGGEAEAMAMDRWSTRERKQQVRDWLTAYYDALRRFREGVRDVEFPRGTWWMCERLGCRVAPA